MKLIDTLKTSITASKEDKTNTVENKDAILEMVQNALTPVINKLDETLEAMKPKAEGAATTEEKPAEEKPVETPVEEQKPAEEKPTDVVEEKPSENAEIKKLQDQIKKMQDSMANMVTKPKTESGKEDLTNKVEIQYEK